MLEIAAAAGEPGPVGAAPLTRTFAPETVIVMESAPSLVTVNLLAASMTAETDGATRSSRDSQDRCRRRLRRRRSSRAFRSKLRDWGWRRSQLGSFMGVRPEGETA